MNPVSLSPFTSPSIVSGLPADEAALIEAGESPAGGSTARPAATSGARLLNAGCYSVSIFGSGADYGAF